MSENINFFLNEENISDSLEDNDLSLILNEIHSNESETMLNPQNMDSLFHEVVNYNINYTVKQLLQICEYYNILKEVKISKCKKEEIIDTIILFESNPENYNIVFRRKQLWFYIDELKNDKFMKKFILWK